MDRSTQRELVDRILDQHARRTTTLAETTMRIPADRYVSERFHQDELATLFRCAPSLVCMSTDLPNPGDSVPTMVGDVPVIVTRSADGGVRAFVNVCRHRAATVLDAPVRGARSFSCPFHGWVYDADDGRLAGQPRSCDGFAEVNRDCLGLQNLGAGEAHGLVVVRPDGDAPVDVDDWLAGLGPELAAAGYDGLTPYRSESTAWRCNWKLLLDTFLESYHVFALHKASLGSFYLGIASPFDAFGPHNRIVVPQTSILQMAEVPPEERELLPYAVLQYFLAPNVIVSNLYGYVMIWRFLPHGPSETTVEHTLYTYAPVATDEDREHFDQRFAAAASVTGNEDFPASENIHRNLSTGLVDTTMAGRNEPGMVHFHRMIEAAVTAS